jgi:hypothetical protein
MPNACPHHSSRTVCNFTISVPSVLCAYTSRNSELQLSFGFLFFLGNIKHQVRQSACTDTHIQYAYTNTHALQTGVRIRLTRTDPSDPLHNVSLVPEHLEGAQLSEPFDPDFLSMLQNASVLRFSGWQRTDHNDYNPANNVRNTSVRTTATFQTQNRRDGVAVEYMVALSNKIGAVPWFGMPRASSENDAYHALFATIVRDQLDPRLKVMRVTCVHVRDA